MVAAVLVGEEAGQALVLVVAQPGVNGVRVARAEQAVVGHGVRGAAIGDLEHGGAALTGEGLGVVVAVVQQGGALVVRERQGTALAHREVSSLGFRYTIIRAYRTCSSKFIRLLRHLRDEGRTEAEDDERPGATYNMHDALEPFDIENDRMAELLLPLMSVDEQVR